MHVRRFSLFFSWRPRTISLSLSARNCILSVTNNYIAAACLFLHRERDSLLTSSWEYVSLCFQIPRLSLSSSASVSLPLSVQILLSRRVLRSTSLPVRSALQENSTREIILMLSLPLSFFLSFSPYLSAFVSLIVLFRLLFHLSFPLFLLFDIHFIWGKCRLLR